MSTTPESLYFPSLDKCLAINERLLSWRTAYRAVADGPTNVNNTHLERFLTEDDSINILTSALDPFGSPSPASESQLETKTAPINVSQEGDGDYNVAELKEDAKWLAQELQIGELAALRIAIIELQERAADQLFASLSQAQSTALPISNLNTSSFPQKPSATILNRDSLPSLDYSRVDIRRNRMLDVYFSEAGHIARLATDLVGRHAVEASTSRDHRLPPSENPRNWIDNLAAKVTQKLCSGENGPDHGALCTKCITSLDRLLQRLEDKSSWPSACKTDDARELAYINFQLTKMTYILRLLLSSIYSIGGTVEVPIVQAWFTLMDKCGFFQNSQTQFAPLDVSAQQYLISVISVSILKVPTIIEQLVNTGNAIGSELPTKSYLKHEECLHFLNTMLYRCATYQVEVAALAIYGWSVISTFIREIARSHRALKGGAIDETDDHASRRGSREWISDHENLNDFLSIQDLGEDPSRFFASMAIDRMRVFSMIANLSIGIDSMYSSPSESSTSLISKITFLEIVREGVPLVEYGGEVLEAIIAILSPDNTNQTSQQHARILGTLFLTDNVILRPAVLDQAISRNPYELSPFLRLCKVLASTDNPDREHRKPLEMVQLLDNLPSFTQMVPEEFRSYQLDHEDENTNNMTLTDDLAIFTIKQNLVTWNSDYVARRALLSATQTSTGVSRVELISAGTPGVLVKETRPFVLKLDHAHSGLEYLGLLLSTFLANGELRVVAPSAELERFEAAELISLLSALLSATLTSRRGINEALFILGRYSFALANEQDIISVIADVFEAELLANLDQVSEDGSLALVTACAEALVLLVDISPERVWSILARSSLLGVNSNGVSLVAVVGGIEAQLGRYRFLTVCVQLYDRLLSDAIAGLVKRKSQMPKLANRFDSPTESLDAIPQRTISTVLGAFQRILLDTFQNFLDWRFEVPYERCEIVSLMVDAFAKLVRSTYGINIERDISRRLTGALVPAAESLLELCAPRAGPSPLIKICVKIIPDGLLAAGDSVHSRTRVALIKQTRALLGFLVVLIRAAKPGESESSSATTGSDRARNLATDISAAIPSFAALLASDHALKAGLFPLLSELVQAITTDDKDPPSILGELNTATAKAFLQVVTQLDRPLCDVHIERQAWDFLAAIMSSKQKWFAIYLLTGTVPKDRAKRGSVQSARPKSLLNYALDQLSNISSLSPDRAAGMLRFVAHAQQTWVLATNELRSHPDFFKNTLAWLDSLEAPSGELNPAAALVSAREYEMATYLCDILAINVHASLEINDSTVLKLLITKTRFLRDHGVIVNTYKRSLHKRLAENIKAKYPQSELSDFKRTDANPAPFGTEYYYDRTLAATVLSHKSAWQGTDRDRNLGYSNEFALANTNLSLYSAQIGLLRSWKRLATTLSECVDQDAVLQVELAQVAERCLTANSHALFDEPATADLLQLRGDLAFVLSSRLVSLKVAVEPMKELLSSAWRLVRGTPVDYNIATASEDVRYYRGILQVLYLSVQPHQYMHSSQSMSRATDETKVQHLAPDTASQLIDIVGKVIMPGFRALCGNLHTDMSLALPADFALLTALLQAILSVPGISSVSMAIADIVAGSSVIRTAVSLFSWADQLAEVTNQDPIYGELAILFLIALSTIRPVAEQMALEGVLVQLSSANLSNYLRKAGGKGPFDEPQRMFSIWTEGFLPLCLNLLDAVGPPIASSVASFLVSFPEQLKRAEKALQNASPSARAGAVTLGLVSEAHSLTMISTILSSDIARGAAEGINAADIPPLGYETEVVKEIVESLVRNRKGLNERVTAVGPLEGRWQMTVVPGASDNMLTEKIVKELTSMHECFGESETSQGV